MLDLSNVTLVSIDSVADHYSKSNIRLAAISRIVPKLLEQINFGDVLCINPFGKNKDLIYENFEAHWKSFKVNLEPKNIAWYSNFVIKQLPFIVKTDWYLVIQWDGFPIHTGNWINDFFNYEFLGGGHSVYNGGFSLRNTKTMRRISEIEDDFETGAEDCFYSAFLNNEWMQQKKTPFKINWAEKNIVDKFCFWEETGINDGSFGWHRGGRLSKASIEKMYKALNIFTDEEISKLVGYSIIKEIHTPEIFEIDKNYNFIKNIDIEYNQSFFDNY